MTTGTVYLVGAGPGDPGLITVKGLRLIQTSDVVVYDRLVDDRLLKHARLDAQMIDVGKVPGSRANRQSDINALIVRLAKRGKSVVRLKGGDPFVFGRGGEEAEELRANEVPFEIVPGITSAIAAPAYAGIPVTHRGLASSFTVVTGNETPDKPENVLDWSNLAQQRGTLIILMGWQNLPAITEALVKYGRPSDTPVALVQWGTESYQKTVTGSLCDIVEKAKESSISSPVVTIVGEVSNLRGTLEWFDNRPLFGKKVLVTRTRTQAGVLSERLMQRGAESVELPTIEIKELDDYSKLNKALINARAYSWVFFTSANAVDIVFKRLEILGLDSRAFGNCKVGAIGPATAKRLRGNGISPDLIPDSFVSESILDSLKTENLSGSKVLLPRADIARDALNLGLTDMGAQVDEIPTYKTVTPASSFELVSEVLDKGLDIATFSSSSTVKNLLELIDGDIARLSGVTIACIGPITAKTASDMGLEVDIIAKEHTINGLVEAIESHFAGR